MTRPGGRFCAIASVAIPILYECFVIRRVQHSPNSTEQQINFGIHRVQHSKSSYEPALNSKQEDAYEPLNGT